MLVTLPHPFWLPCPPTFVDVFKNSWKTWKCDQQEETSSFGGYQSFSTSYPRLMPKFTWPEVSSCLQTRKCIKYSALRIQVPEKTTKSESSSKLLTTIIWPLDIQKCILIMGKFVGILNADSQNICTCQLFSFWALFYATASPVFMQTGMKSAFSYTQCLRPEHRWPRSSPRFCLLFLGNSSTHQRKWAAKRIRRLAEWYDCLLA